MYAKMSNGHALPNRSTFIGVALVGAGVVALGGCSFPGVRPEGRVQSISASAPAPRDTVFRRARGWFARNAYVIVRESGGTSIVAHRPISVDGAGATQAVIEFEIRNSSATETAYRVTSRTERGGREVDRTDTQTIPGIDALISYLSCPAARWPSCP
jgi:hypothetical protein